MWLFRMEEKMNKKNICIVLFSIWVTFSGAALAIGMDIGNNFLKFAGGISLLIIILLILFKSTQRKTN